MPGDRIAVALAQDLPQKPAIVAGILDALFDGQAEPDEVAIILSATKDSPHQQRDDEIALKSKLSSDAAELVTVVTHDPLDEKQLSYLAASKDNKPIYLNRRLFDADLVIPVGCLRPAASLGYAGVHSGLFPAFSNQDAQNRFRAPTSADASVHQRLRHAEADEVAWLLGVQFTVQIVPGRGDSILHVVAGESAAVQAAGRTLCEAAWSFQVERPASLVVATIEGGREQQSWENFARALFAASAAATESGTIVLCTDLQCHPGPALQRLAGMSDDATNIHEIRRERSNDAISASLLAEIRQRHRVYLLSGLDSDTVEELGLGYISAADEVSRLIDRHETCALIANAHRAMLRTGTRTSNHTSASPHDPT